MPAKDKYHDTVVTALQKEGWHVEEEQYALFVGNRILWIDIYATNEQQERAILIEVKSFMSASQVEDLANAVGKYFIYRAILETYNRITKLYLSVPQDVFDAIFNEQLGLIVQEKLDISFALFDKELEIITQWIG